MAAEVPSTHPRERSRNGRATSASVLVVVVGGVVFFVGLFMLNRYWGGRHPAVEEHRTDLIDAACRAMRCGNAELSLIVEGPRRARVEGCGQVRTFVWKRTIVRRHPRPLTYTPAKWHQIDPNCRVDYFGCSLPCD